MHLGLIISCQDLLDLADQFLLLRGSLSLDAGQADSADRALGYQTKPALHLVMPGGVGGCSGRETAAAAPASPPGLRT